MRRETATLDKVGHVHGVSDLCRLRVFCAGYHCVVANMICVVLHCDTPGCDLEQGYPIDTIASQWADEPDAGYWQVALRLGAQYGWRHVDGVLTCPEHSGQPG